MKKYLLIIWLVLIFTGCSVTKYYSNVQVDNKTEDSYRLHKGERKSKETMAEQLDRQTKEVTSLYIEMNEYIKSDIDEAERERVKGKIVFAEEVLQKIANLRQFYNDDGTDKYPEYQAKNNSVEESIRTNSSSINNDIKDVNNSFKKMIALSEYIEIGTRERFGESEALNNNLKRIKDSVKNIDNATFETDGAIYK